MGIAKVGEGLVELAEPGKNTEHTKATGKRTMPITMTATKDVNRIGARRQMRLFVGSTFGVVAEIRVSIHQQILIITGMAYDKWCLGGVTPFRSTEQEVIAFLRSKLKLGVPAWKRVKIVEGLICYQIRQLRSKEPRLEQIVKWAKCYMRERCICSFNRKLSASSIALANS